jgi:multicomponent Na+:H+ antiporter subunit E
LYLLLFGLWLALNGRVTLELVCFGLGLTALLGLGLWALFGYSPRRELRLWRKLPLALVYLGDLVWEIVKAALRVLGLVLFKSRRIRPAVIRVRVDLRSEFAKYILANSITLTPGTICVQTQGDVLTVHCLDRSMLEDVENGSFVRLLRRLEA